MFEDLDADTRRDLALVLLATRHLPGLHDQKTHGRRGPVALAKAAARKAAKAAAAATVVEDPPKPRARRAPVPAGAKPYHRNVTEVADIARAVEGGRITEEHELAGGATGDVRLRTYHDGTQVVYKRVVESGTRDRSLADSEQLASLVARRLGLDAPRIYRNSADEVHMDYVANGSVADDHDLSVQRGVMGSHDAYMMGLLDVLTDQIDRHGGNWMITDAGHLVPIDNMSWWSDSDPPELTGSDAPNLGSDFSFALVKPSKSTLSLLGTWKDKNDLRPSDLDEIRMRLRSLKPDFDHLGRGDWFNYMMERLNAIQARATGMTSRLLPAR